MMLENAIRDLLNILPKSENLETKETPSMVKGGVAEVEYIESEKLDDFEDVDKSLKTLLTGLDSKDWVLLCETLNNVRRFSIYHKEALKDILERVLEHTSEFNSSLVGLLNK